MDLNKIINNYIKILQIKMETDEMQFLKKYHQIEYIKKLEEFVPIFKDEYPFLFKKIINGDNLDILNIFLNNITDIDEGKKTLNDARNELGLLLHEKYVNM